MNPEHDRTNPQRAIDEYKKSMDKRHHASIDIWADELKKDCPIVKLGQGRDESPEEDHLIEGLFVIACLFVLVAVLMIGAYLLGAWR